MVDLSKELDAVYKASSLSDKKDAMFILIENSHAKKETKMKAKNQVAFLQSPNKIDFFATNYVFSGEGMKVG